MMTIIISLLAIFLQQSQQVTVQWSRGENKYPQASRTLLRMLVDFNNALVWMVSILPVFHFLKTFFPGLLGPFQARHLQLI